MNDKDVLVLTVPTRCNVLQIFSKTYIWQTPIDPVPLWVASQLQERFQVAFLPLYSIFRTYYPEQDWNKIQTLLDAYQPKAVVFSSDYHIADRSTSAYPVALQISRYLKTKNPDVKIIMTGRTATALGSRILREELAVDAVVIGECEEIIASVVSEILTGKPVLEEGVIYRWNGEIRENAGFNYVKDLDALPPPAYELLREHTEMILHENQSITGKLLFSIRTSRGCVYQCAFCGGVPYWNKYRTRSAKMVDADIQACLNTFGEQARIRFIDDEFFTHKLEHVEAIRDVLQKWNIKLKMVLTIARFFDEKMAETLADFVEMVSFGVENVDDQIVADMHKPQTFAEVMGAVQTARNHGISVNLFWVTGLPGENKQTMFANLQMMYKLLAENQVDSIMTSVLNLHPGIELEQNPAKYGVNIQHKNWGSFNEEGSKPAFHLPELTREEIFQYHLLSQFIVQNASSIKEILGNMEKNVPFSEGNYELFKDFFAV